MDRISDISRKRNASECSDDARSSDRLSSFSEGDSAIVNDLEDETACGICLTDDERRVLNRFRSSRGHRRHSFGDSGVIIGPSFQRRRSFQTLSTIFQENGMQENVLLLQNETHGSQSSVFDMGSQLFLSFLEEEIHRSNLQAPRFLYDNLDRSSSRRSSLQAEEFVSIGRHLRNMADEFAHSDQRQSVRERAESVPLVDLDVTSFTDLLFGIFQDGGITCERVLILFVFCADLALRALQEHLLGLFWEVVRRSQDYIEAWVSPLIQRRGGWSVVLEQSVHEVYRAAVIGVCVMGMVAVWTYIRTAGR